MISLFVYLEHISDCVFLIYTFIFRSKENIFANLTNMHTAGMPNTSKSFMMNNSGDKDDDESEIGTNSAVLDNENIILASEDLSLSEKVKKDVGTQVTTEDLIIYHSFFTDNVRDRP